MRTRIDTFQDRRGIKVFQYDKRLEPISGRKERKIGARSRNPVGDPRNAYGKQGTSLGELSPRQVGGTRGSRGGTADTRGSAQRRRGRGSRGTGGGAGGSGAVWHTVGCRTAGEGDGEEKEVGEQQGARRAEMAGWIGDEE